MYASVCLFVFAVFNFCLVLPNKLYKYIYTRANVRASANFSETLAKEFRPSARESANFAVAFICFVETSRAKSCTAYLDYPLSLAPFR